MFVTRRLQAAPLGPEQFEEAYALLGDPLAMHWLHDGTPFSPEEAKDFLAANAERERIGMPACYALRLKEWGNPFVGIAGFLPSPLPDAPDEAVVAILPEHWRKGFGLEAGQALVEWVRSRQLACVVSVDVGNQASRSLLSRLGLTKTGEGTGPTGLPLEYFAIQTVA